MQSFKEPKDTDRFHWTKHSMSKMKQYALTPQRVIRILNHPERHEEAIVENCFACVQTIGDKRKTEIWAMYQKVEGQRFRRIITAWRYPGVTKAGDKVPLPEGLLDEILL
jgi:hypothetical protein